MLEVNLIIFEVIINLNNFKLMV